MKEELHNAIPLYNGLYVIAWDQRCSECKIGLKHPAKEYKLEELPVMKDNKQEKGEYLHWTAEFNDLFPNENIFDSSSIFHSKYRDGKIGRIFQDLKDFIEKVESTAYQKGVEDEKLRNLKEINRILNKHSKSILDGGLDYVKAFGEMEDYELSLTKPSAEQDKTV